WEAMLRLFVRGSRRSERIPVPKGGLYQSPHFQMSWLPRSSSIPLHRRWMGDIIHFGMKSQTVGCNWIINVAAAAEARKTRHPPVSWVAVWVRAIAMAGSKWPELRTCYLPYPWPRMYLHPFTVATLLVERDWRGASAVFLDTVKNPEALSIIEIDQIFQSLRKLPVESVGAFRLLIRVSKLPLLLRRFLWSIALYWSGRLRSKYVGSIAINFIRAQRFAIAQTKTAISFTIWFGLVKPNGDMLVQLFWDHRVLDGMAANRMIRDLEAMMNAEIVEELNCG